ncbi:MAG TPA: DUF4397 domain-containing protein [Streptosporangiaceae bacterium]|nr:DUF4397 domain-containing protein [Streptosporangiaceae bacterium]
MSALKYTLGGSRRRIGLARLAAGAALVVGALGLAVPAASAAPASGGVGWLRLAHLSPNTPAVDCYLYSFDNPNAKIVLHHVAYGAVSPYEQVPAGEYTVAMRGAGAAPASKPVLSASVDVQPGGAYTVAGMGPYAGLRLQVVQDKLTTPQGKALVRVIQASMRQPKVSVGLNGQSLASQLAFSKISSYVAVSPGSFTVHAAGSSESANATVNLKAGAIYTLVVEDNSTKLGVDALIDAQGSKVKPAGGVQTGFGGTAARPGAPLLPWLSVGLAGLLAAAGGSMLVSRRRRPALHAR